VEVEISRRGTVEEIMGREREEEIDGGCHGHTRLYLAGADAELHPSIMSIAVVRG
jgi:hypothetical protein